MKKLYYAYVAVDVADYYESKLQEYGAVMLHRTLIRNSKDNELYYYYIVEAEENIIDPNWEIKD